MASGCPDPEKLVRLGTAAFGDATYEAINAHVENCPNCQEILQRFFDHGLEMPALTVPDVQGPDQLPSVPGFAVERWLGRGAMGVVYLARQEGIGRPVALKLVAGGPSVGDRERRRWLREAEAASKVRHPNVVTVYSVGDASPWSYLALEYIPGGTLKQRLDGPLPPRVAAELVETIALAVEEVHRAGLLHLDLKPSNILLDGEAGAPWDKVIPKVSDFGISRLAGELGAEGTSFGSGLPVGTPSYMAPEQTGPAGTWIGPAADVHALGAILYELLTGRPPIQANSIVAMLEQVCKHEPVPPRRLNPAVPRDLETICLMCLQKKPGSRYPSAKSLADDLRCYQEGRPIKARPVLVFEKIWCACRRKPLVASLAAALLIALSTGFLGMFLLWRHAESALSRLEDEQGHTQQERRRAEAEHARAEAESRRTIEAFGEIIDLSMRSFFRLEAPGNDHTIARLQRTRRYLLEVTSHRPGDSVLSHQLALLDSRLGSELAQQGRLDEARSTYEESLSKLDPLVLGNPHDHRTLSFQISIRRSLVSVYASQGNVQEGVSLIRRALATGEELMRMRTDYDSINLLAWVRRDFASLLTRQGRIPEAIIQLERVIAGAEELMRLRLDAGSINRLVGDRRELVSLLSRQGRIPEGIIQLERVIAGAEELMRVRPDAESISLLAWVRRDFACLLTRQGDISESIMQFERAIAKAEELMRVRPDADSMNSLACFRRELASLLTRQGKISEGVIQLERAIIGARELMSLRSDRVSIEILANVRRDLVALLTLQGNYEAARSLLEENRSLLAGVSADAGSPQIGYLRIVVRWDIARLNANSRRTPAYAPREDGRGQFDPQVMLASPEADYSPVRSWAELAIGALRAANHASIEPSQETEAGYALMKYIIGIATDQRHDGKLEGSRRVVDRMLALGRLLVERHPDQPAAHLALGEAYMQAYKNAWNPVDRASVEQNLKLAIDETRRAVDLDPNNEIARNHLEERQRRLKNLQASERAAESPNQTVRTASTGS